MQLNYLYLKLIGLLLFCAFAFGQVKAATPIVHLSPKPLWLNKLKDYSKKVAARDIENGYFYQLNEEQIHIEKQADYHHCIREIVSDAGIQNGSQISVSFDPSYEQIDFHEIIVWRNNQPENRLKAGDFKVVADEKELSNFIYQGSYSAYCILADIRKGDRIEYSYTITGRNPIFGNKYSRNLYFQGSQQIAHQYKAILTASNRTLHFKEFNNPPHSSTFVKNGLTTYVWENYQVKPEWDYNNQPGWFNNFAYIQISDFNSWAEVTNWALKINPLATNLSGNLGLQVAKLKTAAAGNKEKYFTSAVKLVQNEVRYMGIEIGEYSHRANNPGQVFNQRYGDCKDKSLLLASILKADGIDAYMVLVNSDIKAHINQFIPTSNAFDHAIVVATLNGKQVWIDPTISYQGGVGSNIYFPNYGMGLVLKAGNTGLTTIAPTPAGRIMINENYTIPDEKGKVKLDVTTIYTLNEADDQRSRLAGTSMAETERSYLNYYTKIHPKIKAKDSITVIDDEKKDKLTVIEHYLITGFLKPDSNSGKYIAALYANYVNDNLPGISNTAHIPIALTYPYNLDYTLNVIMDGWNVENKKAAAKTDAFEFSGERFVNGDTLVLKYRYHTLQDYIPVNKFDEYRQTIKRISDDNLSFTFNYTPDVNALPYRPNYWMIAGISLLCIGLAGLFFRIYRTETPAIVFTAGSNFTPLGGWLIFIAIGLAVTPILILVNTINNAYFDLNKWNTHTYSSQLLFHIEFLFEVIGNVALIFYSAFCFILLINRRDILPKFIIVMYVLAVIILVVNCALTFTLTQSSLSEKTITALVRTIISAAIWIPYFKRSTRVEETFIVPYPASNFSYEQLQQRQES